MILLESYSLYLAAAVVAQLVKSTQLQMPFWLVVLALVWGFALSSWVLGMRLTPVLRGVIGLALGVPSILVLVAWNAGEVVQPFGLLSAGGLSGVGLFIGSVVFLLVIWWRGVELSREDITLDAVRAAFQIGMIVLLATALIDAAVEGSIVNGFLVVGFFAVGLPGMALARFSAESSEERELPAQWIWPILACVGGVLCLGLLISVLGVGGLDDVTRTTVRAVGQLGYRILEPILMVIGFIAGGLVSAGNWLSSVLGGGDIDGLLEAQRRIDQFHESLREAESKQSGDTLFTVMKWIAATLGIVAASWIVYSLFRARRRHSLGSEVVERRESLFSLKRASDDLGEAVGGLFSGWWPGSRRQHRPRTVREYYHALLDLAERAGRRREEWETPREHQRELAGVLPSDPVASIVDQFQASHYGASLPDHDQLERLEADRQALEAFLREQRTEG